MQLTPEEQKISNEATTWVKQNIGDLFQNLIGDKDYSKVKVPAATFMAGTPGAG